MAIEFVFSCFNLDDNYFKLIHKEYQIQQQQQQTSYVPGTALSTLPEYVQQSFNETIFSFQNL